MSFLINLRKFIYRSFWSTNQRWVYKASRLRLHDDCGRLRSRAKSLFSPSAFAAKCTHLHGWETFLYILWWFFENLRSFWRYFCSVYRNKLPENNVFKSPYFRSKKRLKIARHVMADWLNRIPLFAVLLVYVCMKMQVSIMTLFIEEYWLLLMLRFDFCAVETRNVIILILLILVKYWSRKLAYHNNYVVTLTEHNSIRSDHLTIPVFREFRFLLMWQKIIVSFTVFL